MTVDRTRLVVPDYPTNNLVWGRGLARMARWLNIIPTMINEINLENTAIDMVSYRLTVPTLTDAIVNKKKAGVPVRVFVEPTQYGNAGFPVLARRQRDRQFIGRGHPDQDPTRDGIAHLKTLITSRRASFASSNYTKNWQRDHNYYITAAEKPTLYMSMKDEFERMWNDTANYTDFYPLKPNAPGLSAPGTGAIDVSTLPKLEWKQTPWAVTFDVYLGTSPAT